MTRVSGVSLNGVEFRDSWGLFVQAYVLSPQPSSSSTLN